jgi:hypothetical protein
MPSSTDLPEASALAPRRAPEPVEPVAQNYPAVLGRPIFAPDRAPVLLQAQSAGNLAGYEVLGTAIAGTISAALVRDATGRIVRVKPDAILQGWRLVSIDRTQLVFDRDGERRSLTVSATAPTRPAVGTAQSGGSKASSDDDSSSDSDSDSSDSDDDNDN